MKLSGTAALYTQLKYHENAVALTKRIIAMQEEFENADQAPAKKTKARKPRTPKALPYDGVIGNPQINGVTRSNGAEQLEA